MFAQQQEEILKNKKIAVDVIWSIAALVLMNGVLQLFIYPSFNSRLGAEKMGDVLYALSILAIFSPALGSAANNARLVEKREHDVKNGDILLVMFPLSVIFAVLYVMIISGYLFDPLEYIMAGVLLVLTVFRYYGDVEYRLSLNYKGYFVYYLTISLGYIAGVLLYPVTNSWILVFLIGEAASNVVVLISGKIYRPLTLSENHTQISRKILVLTLSYLLYNGVLNLDRILLQNLIDSETVTIYYVGSLLGKTAALLVGPLNSVILSYMSKNNTQITRKQYMKISAVIIGVGAVIFAVILAVMPLFVDILYKNISARVLEISTMANLSQIICFSSSLLLTIMLTFASAKWQLIIQASYAAVFLALGIAGAKIGGLQGFIIAILLANIIRLVLVFGIGVIKLNSGVNNK